VITFVKANVMKNTIALETFFQALGDRTRLRIVNLLALGEVCVCYLIAILDEPQPKVSRHLAYLRRAGVVNARRDGKWMHYRLAPLAGAPAGALLDVLLVTLAGDARMQRDRRALQRACCTVSFAAVPADAPRPSLLHDNG
jgi:ArsR family transcriptional regulator